MFKHFIIECHVAGHTYPLLISSADGTLKYGVIIRHSTTSPLVAIQPDHHDEIFTITSPYSRTLHYDCRGRDIYQSLCMNIRYVQGHFIVLRANDINEGTIRDSPHTSCMTELSVNGRLQFTDKYIGETMRPQEAFVVYVKEFAFGSGENNIIVRSSDHAAKKQKTGEPSVTVPTAASTFADIANGGPRAPNAQVGVSLVDSRWIAVDDEDKAYSLSKLLSRSVMHFDSVDSYDENEFYSLLRGRYDVLSSRNGGVLAYLKGAHPAKLLFFGRRLSHLCEL